MHATKPVMNSDGTTFSWSYIITLTNKQNQLIDSVRIVDDLSAVFSVNPRPGFSISKISATGNTLKANNAYNGTSVTGLLSDRSYLDANGSDSIIIEVSVNPNGYAGKLSNTAYVDGMIATGMIKGAPTDDSGLPGSADPASTVLSAVELTIPDGFTPNGDGFNEKFVIVHPDSLKLKIIIFNRWGNQVYSNNDYQNDWNGKGSGGNDLATGTYFLEIYATNVSTGEIVRKELKYITLRR
jgi:gliding motility-associated-like protein